MKAGKRHESPANVRELAVPDLDDLPQTDPQLYTKSPLAGQLAFVAHDASVRVKQEAILFAGHDFLPS